MHCAWVVQLILGGCDGTRTRALSQAWKRASLPVVQSLAAPRLVCPQPRDFRLGDRSRCIRNPLGTPSHRFWTALPTELHTQTQGPPTTAVPGSCLTRAATRIIEVGLLVPERSKGFRRHWREHDRIRTGARSFTGHKLRLGTEALPLSYVFMASDGRRVDSASPSSQGHRSTGRLGTRCRGAVPRTGVEPARSRVSDGCSTN